MTPGISLREYAERIAALQRTVADADLDCFVVSSFDNIYYLTGTGFEPLERPFFLLVPPEGACRLLVPLLDQEHMTKARTVPSDCIESYREFPAPDAESWPSRLRGMLGAASRIAVEPSISRSICDQLNEYELDVLPLVERQRLVKSPAEIEMIRRAARFADDGVNRLIQASYFGSTVCEGFAQTSRVSAQIIRETGTDWEPVTTRMLMATWAAPRSGQPHSIPALNDTLREGPHVALVLARINGYSAESERTYFTSHPSADERSMFETMLEARRQALEMVRPGVPCAHIDEAVSEFLAQEGFADPEQRLHRTGHGIGLGTHEGPWIAAGSDDVLQEDMVVSIEPGLYLNGVGGIRHSDTVLVTTDGFQCLTRCAEDISTLTQTRWKPLVRLKGHVVRRALGVTPAASPVRRAPRRQTRV